MQERKCAVCGSDEKRILFAQRFSGLSEGSLLSGYDVAVCQKCGFCFADNLPNQEAFDQYYRDMSKYERQDHGGGMTEYDQRRFPITAKLIARHVHDPNARILDVGCSTGGLLYFLRQQGFHKVTGLDPSPVCAQVANDLYQVRVITGALADLSPTTNSFDVIILGSVLEHIQDLTGALARLRALLSAQAVLLFEVPDATAFAYSFDAPFQEFSIEHINYFSTATLTNLMRAHGFTLIFARSYSAEQSQGKVIHEIKAMFKKTKECLNLLAKDETAEKGILDYIAKSRDVERYLHKVIDNWANNHKPIIVWGVGTHTQRLLATSPLARTNIVAFVDSNPRYQGKLLNNVRIISPNDLKNHTEPILISSLNFQQEIEKKIRDDLKLNNEIITLYSDID